MKKLLGFLIILCLILSTFAITIYAAPSVKSSASKTTAFIGDTVTITFTFTADKAIGVAEPRIEYDTSVFSFQSLSSGGGANIYETGFVDISYWASDGFGSSTYKVEAIFKALKVGECTFKVSFPQVGLHTGGQEYIGAPKGSITVTVKHENKPSNANLKWLTVPKGCTLVPKFSKDVTNYTCTVPGSVTSFPMDWEKEDPKATDVVSGALNLKVGENTRKVTVTAQDGTKKVYTVKITRLAPENTATPAVTPTPTPAPTQEPIKVTVDEQEHTLNPIISLTLPDGFNKETHLYNGTEIETAVLSGIKLVQLNDGTRDMFFAYSEQTHTFSAFKQIANTNKTYTALEEKPDILPESAIGEHKVINDGEYTAWPFTQFGEGYYIIHIMNSLGEKYPAVYCEADGSIQKLSLKALETEQTGTNIEITPKPVGNFFDNLKIDWMLVAIIVCAIILVAIIVVIIVMLAKNKKTKKQEAPKRQWGFEDPYDININEEEEVKNETTFSEDDIDFN